jgi:hypothetical protein
MADLNLVFRRPRYTGGPIDLVFGAEEGGGGGEGFPVTATATIVVGPIGVQAVAFYDNKNPRRVSVAASTPFQKADRVVAEPPASWTNAAKRVTEPLQPWQQAGRVVAEPVKGWVTPDRVLGAWAAVWTGANKAETTRAMVHQTALMFRSEAVAPWQVAQGRQTQALAPFRSGTAISAQVALHMQAGDKRQAFALVRFGSGTPRAIDLRMPWQQARPIPPGLSVIPVDPGTTTPRVIDLNLVFACPAYAGGPVNLVFGRVCGGPVDPGGTIVVPIRSVYMTFNTMLLRRVAGDITLPASAFSMSVDVDSWTWNWSATVQGAALELLQPEAGEPVELEVVINGVPYRLLSEDVERTRRFGSNSLLVTGRGLAAAIDDPYAPVMNFGNTEALTAQQIALAALTLNGESIGWNIDWNLTDWLVPTGAWSHQGAHMSAINTIAAAAGGYVQPHPTLKTLRVLPRYPSAPWDWGSVTPDFELPSAPVVVEGIKWVKRPAYNRVYVSGQGQGVLGRVTRTGTAGDLEAPMVVDALITHADAARQRGLRELANTGNQAMVSLSLPVLSETGLILPGNFVQYVDGATERLGIVRSTSVDWQRPRLRQSITLETHVEA